MGHRIAFKCMSAYTVKIFKEAVPTPTFFLKWALMETQDLPKKNKHKVFLEVQSLNNK